MGTKKKTEEGSVAVFQSTQIEIQEKVCACVISLFDLLHFPTLLYKPDFPFLHDSEISTIQKVSNISKALVPYVRPFLLQFCLFFWYQGRFLVMSAVVDIWTRELAKLREKGQSIYSDGSSPRKNNNAESSQKVQAKEEGSTGLVQAFSRFKRANSPKLIYSDASISMLVDSFCA